MSDSLHPSGIETDDEPEMGHRGEIIFEGECWHAEEDGRLYHLFADKHDGSDGICVDEAEIRTLFYEVTDDE